MRANSVVQVAHLSWTRILTTAVRLREHAGVSDPEQAWILHELIRYLEQPKSGTLALSDMGPSSWPSRPRSPPPRTEGRRRASRGC